MKRRVTAGKHGTFLIDIPDSHDSEALREAWNEYVLHRQQIKHPMSLPCAEKNFKKILRLPLQDALRWLDCAVEMSWRGLFEPPADWQGADEPQKENTPRWGTT